MSHPAGSGTSPTVGPLFAALADDTRRRLLDVIATRGAATATGLAGEVPVSRQAIAKHLGLLREAGLVASQRCGREHQYRVVPGSLRPAADWIATTDSAWSHRLERLQRHLERPGS